jgi:biopolymer transport protein ExbB/TolQ
MLTFATIGSKGLVDTGQIMSGLALALKATAVGLAVAIPSVIMYNLLLRSAKELIFQWEITMEEKEFDYMNVIPLVDVMMVLLTIVLMTSTFIASGVLYR